MKFYYPEKSADRRCIQWQQASNYIIITTAGVGYKDVVGFHSDKQRF